MTRTSSAWGLPSRSFGFEYAVILARGGIGQPHTSQEARRVRHPRHGGTPYFAFCARLPAHSNRGSIRPIVRARLSQLAQADNATQTTQCRVMRGSALLCGPFLEFVTTAVPHQHFNRWYCTNAKLTPAFEPQSLKCTNSALRSTLRRYTVSILAGGHFPTLHAES